MKKVLKAFIVFLLILVMVGCNTTTNNDGLVILTFDNGEGVVIDQIKQLPLTSITQPKEPKKEGYVFIGWDKDLPVIMPKKDMTFTAKWAKNDVIAVFELLQFYYYKDLPLDISQIESIDELYDYLDPYTFLFKADTRAIDNAENYVGLGVTVNQLEEGLLIVDINKNSVVDEYLYVGDIITSVDGTDLSTVDYEDRIPLILGSVGTKRLLGFKRFGNYDEITFALRDINNESVTKKMFGTVGYLYINRFGPDTGFVFNNHLKALERSGMTDLIIDVRNDGGGYLNAVVAILYNFIVDSDPFLTMHIIKNDEKSYYRPQASVKKDYNITVLVNERSASASEVLAIALKQEGYDVYGTKTFGKDVFQSSEPIGLYYPDVFDEDVYLQITLGYWYPHDGNRVKGGINPTIYHPQTGILSLEYPVLLKSFELGDSHPLIETFQYLVNLEVKSDYERGYFNEVFEEALKIYQENNGLEITGKLDLSTQMKLVDSYRIIIKDYDYDNQLNSLINSLNK